MEPERYLLFPYNGKGGIVMTTISLISSILLAIFATVVALIALECLETNGHLREDDPLTGKKKFVGFGGVDTNGRTAAVVLGLLSGLVNFFSQFLMHQGLPVLAIIMMFIMMAAMAVVAVCWLKEGSEWREIVPFLILELLLFAVARQAALAGGVAVAESRFWYSVITILPAIAIFAACGGMIAGTAKYRYEERPGLSSDQRSRNRGWFRAVVVLTIIALLLSAIFGISWGSLVNFTNPASKAGWIHYYNLDLQNNENAEDDYNFGFATAGTTTAEIEDDFRSRLKTDPMLGAADIAWLDAKLGTQYLGSFYAEENDWARAINSAVQKFSTNQVLYYETLDVFFAFLDSAVQVSVRDCQAVVDQMYANPHTASGIPEVVVFKTTDHSGQELVYTFSIKGNVYEVAYRINCGFQPTNVEEVMGIPAQDNPLTPTPEPTTESETEPTPTPEPTTEEPTTEEPTTEPRTTEPETELPTKNPAELPSTDTERNDNTGPGEITINPSDPQHSSEDTVDGSTSLNSYEEYKETIESLQSVNDSQKVGGDSNTPSTTPMQPAVNVDNNGNAGTGNGGIDTATPIQEHAQTSNGSSISNTEDNPAGVWEGVEPT